MSDKIPYYGLAGIESAEERYGHKIHELARWFNVGDPDWDVGNAPHRVSPPAWLDAARCDRGGLVLRRHGILASTVLRAYALPLSYLSPVGIRPLTFTKELLQNAGPRLYRTAQYVVETQQAGAMHHDGPGWKTAATIRTIHQRVRLGLLASDWPEEFGVPLPQADVAVTAMLFGPLTVKGMRALGAKITSKEADDVAHLSRVIAFGQGVVAELQTDTHDQAIDLFERLTSLHGVADEDSRALMEALLNIPYELAQMPVERALAPILKSFYRSLSAGLLGEEKAGSLGIHSKGRVIRRLRFFTKHSPFFHRKFSPVHDRLIHRALSVGAARVSRAE